jgi:predicted kinase
MRKWMRDKFKRRKSKTEDQAKTPDASQAPLQPAYFDAQEPAPETPVRREEEPAQPVESAPEPIQASTPSPASGEASVDRSRRRRRRGRGGRGGRGSARPATAAQPSAATPELPPLTPASAAPKPPATATPRTPKGVVVLAIGLPGSGKSSWFKRHNITPLSSDLLRTLLFDDATEQRFQDLVFSNLRSMLKARLIARRPTNYVDATNLAPHDRRSWIKMAHDFGYEVHAVFFDVAVEVCMERNQRRERMVPEDVMQRMAAKLKPPTFDEGFAKITVVKVKKKEEG